MGREKGESVAEAGTWLYSVQLPCAAELVPDPISLSCCCFTQETASIWDWRRWPLTFSMQPMPGGHHTSTPACWTTRQLRAGQRCVSRKRRSSLNPFPC